MVAKRRRSSWSLIMKTFFLAAAALAALPTAAMAQDTAPDGSPAFGFEPFVRSR
jgi:hypothetical protein